MLKGRSLGARILCAALEGLELQKERLDQYIDCWAAQLGRLR